MDGWMDGWMDGFVCLFLKTTETKKTDFIPPLGGYSFKFVGEAPPQGSNPNIFMEMVLLLYT